MYVSLDSGVRLVGLLEELRTGTQPEWMTSQGVFFEPRAGGELRIVGFYNNKQTNKQTQRMTYIVGV